MYTILVTGGAGFVGGNFVRSTLERGGTRVVNLDLLSYPGGLEALAPWRDSPQHVFIQGDIGDRPLVTSLLRRYECQGIVNFAAETSVERSIGDPGSFVRTNVVSTFELLEAALAYWESLAGELRQQFRFLHVSTDEVFGSLSTDGFFTEQSPYAPNSPYAASKASSDHFVRAYQHTYGLPVLTAHCSNNYGPYQSPEQFIPLAILNVLRGKPVSIYGSGQNVRDWIHVEDNSRALQLILQHGRNGEVYNVGGNCERTNLEVATTICDIVDELRPELPHGPSTRLLRFVPDSPSHDFRYAVDSSKIQRQLGWRPTIGFRQGIERTVLWYRDNVATSSVATGSVTAGSVAMGNVAMGDAPGASVLRGEHLASHQPRHPSLAAGPLATGPKAMGPTAAAQASAAAESSVAVAEPRVTAESRYPESRYPESRHAESRYPESPYAAAEPRTAAPDPGVAVAEPGAGLEPTLASRTVRTRNQPWHQNIDGVQFVRLNRQTTLQGAVAELYQERQTHPGGWPIINYLTETPPKVTHGPHASSSEPDYLAFVGPSDFQLSLWDLRISSATHGNRIECVLGMSDPQAVVIPPGVVHFYKNIGEQVGCVLNSVKRLPRPGFEQTPEAHGFRTMGPGSFQ